MKETPLEISLILPSVDSSGIDKILGGSESGDGEETDNQIAFSLEYQLCDFIAANLNAIDVHSRRLRLYVDPTGRDGIEFQTVKPRSCKWDSLHVTW